MTDWSNVKKILCIRPDNMGDLLMSGPAMRALKETLNAHITVLTSSSAAAITPYMPEIDEAITFDVPWVKANEKKYNTLPGLIKLLSVQNFDAAVIFTVYSQNPLPSAMIAYQAGIPQVLAYCRENPYDLISDWVPDKEPYKFIQHQVERDLKLVESIGALTNDKRLMLKVNESYWPKIVDQLRITGFNIERPWLILHAGVSEFKRQLPGQIWIETAKQLIGQGYQILLTGTVGEKELIAGLKENIGEGAFDAAGLFDIGSLITLISHAPLLLSVNTGTVHLAAAVGTPVVVLYAQTNPQHTPWMVANSVIEFTVQAEMKSKNEIIRYVDETVYSYSAKMPEPCEIVNQVNKLIRQLAASGQAFHGVRDESLGTPAN